MTTAANSKVTLHMVSSLDGFIAKKDGDISWMNATDHYEKGVTLSEEEVADFLETIECYVMGSKTYEQALELGWPYGAVPVIVLTNRNLEPVKDSVKCYAGDLQELINDQLKPKFRNIWLVGGAMVAKEFIHLDLVDEIVLTIMPIILGGGTLFFDYIGQEKPLHLLDVTAYQDGMVELSYAVKKEGL